MSDYCYRDMSSGVLIAHNWLSTGSSPYYCTRCGQQLVETGTPMPLATGTYKITLTPNDMRIAELELRVQVIEDRLRAAPPTPAKDGEAP